MKSNRRTQVISILFLFIIAVVSMNFTRKQKAVTGIPHLSDSIEWTFTPSQVNPQYGNPRPVITGDYTLEYSKGKITAYLPYYGRAYSGADVLADRSPLYFTSTDFTTDTKAGKKGRKELIITFKDQREISKMYFTIFANGNANLSVNMTNRSAISFIGKVETGK